jgi:hypothetical protein
MEFSVQPPEEARSGVVLSPPIVVKIRQRPSHENDDHGDEGADNSGLLWASASLLDETGLAMLAPPRTDLFQGSLVDSARPFSGTPDDVEGREGQPRQSRRQAIGRNNVPGASDSFVMFPNLTIRDTGIYRIQVTLSRMEKGGSTALSPVIGTVTVAKVQSRTIHVT